MPPERQHHHDEDTPVVRAELAILRADGELVLLPADVYLDVVVANDDGSGDDVLEPEIATAPRTRVFFSTGLLLLASRTRHAALPPPLHRGSVRRTPRSRRRVVRARARSPGRSRSADDPDPVLILYGGRRFVLAADDIVSFARRVRLAHELDRPEFLDEVAS